MYQIIISLFLLIGSLDVVAQQSQASQDFERINATYAKLTELKTNVAYVLYPNHAATIPFQQEKASLWISGKNSLYKIGAVETLHTPEYTILIDHDEAQLIVQPTGPGRPDPLTGIELDSLLSYCSELSMQEEANSRTYTLSLPFGELERIQIRFDRSTYLMEKVILYYRQTEEMEEGLPAEKPRLEINYLSQENRARFAKDAFSIYQYIQHDGTQFQPITLYQSYQFIDYTRTNE